MISLLASCVNQGDRDRKMGSNDSIPITDTVGSSSPDSISPREYGMLILEGKVKPSDNRETEACLEQLLAEDQADRDFYFRVYRKIADNSDGALADIVSGFTKAFFTLYPDYCIMQLNEFEAKEKDAFLENLAYEFYASGIDYKEDIDEYFRETELVLKSKSASNLKALKEIKSQLINKARRMNE